METNKKSEKSIFKNKDFFASTANKNHLLYIIYFIRC